MFKLKFIHILYAILGLTVLGELYRLDIGIGDGVIISDILIPITFAAWLIINFKNRKKLLANYPKSFNWLLAFQVLALVSLINSLFFLEPSQVAVGAMYWVRFVSYSFLGLITYYELQNESKAHQLLKGILIATVLISVAGIIQLYTFPDLSSIVDQGWDPHHNRLVSTWLDPNFVGGFLSFMFAIFLSIMLHMPESKKRSWLIAALVLLEVSMFVTYSRSAYLAFIAGTLIVTLFKSKKVLILIAITFALQLYTSPYASSRVASLSQNGGQDPTAALRIQSWVDAVNLTAEKPILGFGYNNLATVKTQKDILRSDSDHSASGSDASLLTILAATGILGFIPFFLFYLMTFIQNFRTRHKGKIPGLSLGLAGGIAALFIHSIIVNSLLFPQMMIYFFIIWGIYQWNVNSVTSN